MKKFILLISAILFINISITTILGKNPPSRPAYINTISKTYPFTIPLECGINTNPDDKDCSSCHTKKKINTLKINDSTSAECSKCPKASLLAATAPVELKLEAVPVTNATYRIKGSLLPGACNPAYAVIFEIFKSTDNWVTTDAVIYQLPWGVENPSFSTYEIYNYADVNNQFILKVAVCDACIARCAHSGTYYQTIPFFPSGPPFITTVNILPVPPIVDPWDMTTDSEPPVKISYTVPSDVDTYDFIKLMILTQDSDSQNYDSLVIHYFPKGSASPMEYTWLGYYLRDISHPLNGTKAPPGNCIACVSIDNNTAVEGDRMIKVLGIDLSLEGVNDDKEETIGGFVGKHYLIPLFINQVINSNTGRIVLKAENASDANKIALWRDEEQNGSPPPLPREWMNFSILPKERWDFWVEGLIPSASPADNIVLVLEYYNKEGIKIQDDKVKITVDGTIIGVDKIQYKIESGSYADMPALPNLLFIAKGTTVNFKAIINPTGAAWPAEKPVWGGTSGASGTGETTSVTFNSTALKATAFKRVTAEAGNTLRSNVLVVDVDKIQYKIGSGNFANIPNPLVVAKGTTVDFKAIITPSGASWPDGKPVWGGTSGAVGTAEISSVTFNTTSTNSTDYKTVTTECGSTITANVLVVDIEKIQYKIGSGSYADVPTNPLIIDKGTIVDFKAIITPTGSTWPSGKPVWGGTSGASGTGETVSVTFNTISTSSTDYKTVTTECGNPITANVLVVGVKQIASGGVLSTTDTPGASETLYAAKGAAGATITITATPEPDTVSWPTGTPVWTNATAVTGTSTATFPIDAVSLDANGTIVTATSGTSSKAMKIVVIGVEITNPVDTDADGKVNDFATSANNLTGNAFGYDRSLPTNICTIPVRVKIKPDNAAIQTLFKDKVTVKLDTISNAGFTSALTWDHAVAGDPSTGNLQYVESLGLWEATAKFNGLPAVPAGSWGRVPKGLRNLLYGKRSAVVTVLNPTGSGNIYVKSESYEVYFGDSLVIYGEKMAETTENYINHIQTLTILNPLFREIYEKMNCSIETFNFADDNKALDNFLMRLEAISNMKKMNTEPTKQLDVGYIGDGYYVGGIKYEFARAGDTYFYGMGPAPTYQEGSEWQHIDRIRNKRGEFIKKPGIASSLATLKLYPFRGECAGAMEICWLQSALNVIGDSRFDVVHPAEFGVGYWYGSHAVHRKYIWAESGGYTGDSTTLVPGDYIYMKNKNDYNGELWAGENCVYYGLDGGTAKFGGSGLSDMTEEEMRDSLEFAYEGEPLNDLDHDGIYDPQDGETYTIIINNGEWDKGDCYDRTVDNPETEIRFTKIGRIYTGE